MNCDEAFEAITRWDSEHNAELDWHLEMCPRCREMQTVLSPALALFVETDDPAETAGIERGPLDREAWHAAEADSPHRPARFLTPEAVRVAEETAASLYETKRPDRTAPGWLAVGLLCLLAGFGLFWGMAKPGGAPNRELGSPVMLADQCLWTNRHSDPPASSSEQSSPRWVVLSCVACHLEPTME